MVAVVVGSRLGLEQTSGWVLGSRGQVGQASLGRSGDQVFLNGMTGNLVVTNQDEFLVGLGLDSAITRTYNSQGELDGDNNDGWRMGAVRRITESVGGVPTRIDWDGSSVAYDVNGPEYRTTAGSGAYDRLKKVGTEWIWTDGDTQVVETYEQIGSTSEYRLKSRTDASGNVVSFTYNAAGRIWKIGTDVGQKTELTEFVYSAETSKTANILELKTSRWDGTGYKPLTRTRYGYDALNRLTTVTVDLSPEDNVVADGRTYVTTYTYDGSTDRVASISQTDGSRISVRYDASGRVDQITQEVAGGVARVTSYSYGSSSVTVSQDGVSTVLTYDASGQLKTLSEPAPVVGGAARVSEFDYSANGDVLLVKSSADVWTRYEYGGTGNQGLWTQKHENMGASGTLLTTRTHTALNALASETRYTLQDADGVGAGLPTGGMTDRYLYDASNRMVFSISAAGVVTEYAYQGDGLLERTTLYTAYTTAPTSTQMDSVLGMTAWRNGLSDAQRQASQITRIVYDFRGEISDTYAYAKALSTGEPDTAGPITHTRYVYDQAGQLLVRHVDGQAGTEAFLYDGLGRVVRSIDFNGAVTRTAYHDAASTTVVTNADGLNQISVYNRAGDLISFTESEQAPNLINLNGWPQDINAVPAGGTSVNGWQNLNGVSTEARWQVVDGPDGRKIVAMQGGQTASNTNPQGGGNQTNSVSIDGTKAYQFVYYFQKTDPTQQSIHFGLSPNATQAYVETNGTWADNGAFRRRPSADWMRRPGAS